MSYRLNMYDSISLVRGGENVKGGYVISQLRAVLKHFLLAHFTKQYRCLLICHRYLVSAFLAITALHVLLLVLYNY